MRMRKFAALGAALLGASAALPAQDALAPQAERSNCAPEPAPVVLPTTGVTFTLPPDAHTDCVVVPPAPVRPPAPSLFRMIALPIGGGIPAQKWESARMASFGGQTGPWNELLEQANRVSSGNPIGIVNQWVNWHVDYRDDDAGDEWAPAPATLQRGYGDCEDFALAKMGLLLALGIPSDDMYLVLLRDQRQSDHAVLAVKRNGRLFVLDNRTDKVLPADAIADYTPVLSFSGPFAWTYGKRTG